MRNASDAIKHRRRDKILPNESYSHHFVVAAAELFTAVVATASVAFADEQERRPYHQSPKVDLRVSVLESLAPYLFAKNMEWVSIGIHLEIGCRVEKKCFLL